MRVVSVDLGSSSVKWGVVDTQAVRILARGQVGCAAGSLAAEVDAARRAVEAAAGAYAAETWTLTGQTTSYVLCDRERHPLMAMFWYSMLARPGGITGSLKAAQAAIGAAGGHGLTLWSLRDWVLAELTGLSAEHTDPAECSALPLAAGGGAPWLGRYRGCVPPWHSLGAVEVAGQSLQVTPGTNDVVADACWALETGCRCLVRVGTSTVVARIGGAPGAGLVAHEIWGGVVVHHDSIASSPGALFSREEPPDEPSPDGDDVQFAYDPAQGTWAITGIGAFTTPARVAAAARRALAAEIVGRVARVGGAQEATWLLMGGGMSDALAEELAEAGAVPRERARRTEIPGWEAVMGAALLVDPRWRERHGIGSGTG